MRTFFLSLLLAVAACATAQPPLVAGDVRLEPVLEGPDAVLDVRDRVALSDDQIVRADLVGRLIILEANDGHRHQVAVFGLAFFGGLPDTVLLLDAAQHGVDLLVRDLLHGALDDEAAQALRFEDRLHVEGDREGQVGLGLVREVFELPRAAALAAGAVRAFRGPSFLTGERDRDVAGGILTQGMGILGCVAFGS